MAENEDLLLGATATRIPFRTNVIASFTLAQECDLCSAMFPFRRDNPAEAVHSGFVKAG
jgi:hypothetical protein